MGTFHDHLGDLHGITVAVETRGGTAYVGRCHEANDEIVHLMQYDTHEDGKDGLPAEEWIKRAAKWGVFPKERTIKLDRGEVTKLVPLGQVETTS